MKESRVKRVGGKGYRVRNAVFFFLQKGKKGMGYGVRGVQSSVFSLQSSVFSVRCELLAGVPWKKKSPLLFK